MEIKLELRDHLKFLVPESEPQTLYEVVGSEPVLADLMVFASSVDQAQATRLRGVTADDVETPADLAVGRVPVVVEIGRRVFQD